MAIADLSFIETVLDLSCKLDMDLHSFAGKFGRLGMEIHIINVIRQMGWHKKPELAEIGISAGLDKYTRACIDVLAAEIPLIGGDDLSWNIFENGDIDLEEFALEPMALGANDGMADDFYCAAEDPRHLNDNFSLLAYLLSIGYELEVIEEKQPKALIKRFHWPNWDLIRVEKHDFFNEDYCRRHVSKEMWAAMQISIIPTANYFLEQNYEDPLQLEFTLENVKGLIKDLKQANKLNELAQVAGEQVQKDPNLLIKLAEVLRKSQEPQPAKKAKSLAEVLND